MQIAKNLISGKNEEFDKISAIRAFVLEMFFAGLRGLLAFGTIANFFSNLYRDTTRGKEPVEAEKIVGYVGPESAEDPLLIPSILMDVLWLLNEELDPDIMQEEGAQERSRLILLGRELMVS